MSDYTSEELEGIGKSSSLSLSEWLWYESMYLQCTVYMDEHCMNRIFRENSTPFNGTIMEALSVSFFMNSIIRNVWNTRMNRDRDSMYATHITWSCSIQCDNWKKCCKTFGSYVVSVCVWMRRHPSKLIHASTTNHIHLVLHSVFAMMKRSKSYFSDSSSVCWGVEK